MTEARRDRRIPPWIVVSVLLVFQSAVLSFIATRTSLTVDEPAHLASGISHWETGECYSYRVNPPLVRLVATLPLVLLDRGVAIPPRSVDRVGRAEFGYGGTWLLARGENAIADMIIARIACLPFAILGGLVVFWWATDLHGTRAGILSLGLWTISPLVLANGALMTPDVGATSLGALACYMHWRWLRNPRWHSALLAGLCAGLALLTKGTWVILFALLPATTLLWLAFDLRSGSAVAYVRRILVLASHQVVALSVAIVVLASGYGYDGWLRPLGTYDFDSEALSGQKTNGGQEATNPFRGTCLARLPVPFPEYYVTGIDLQRLDFELGKRSYLAGEWKMGGWWYYYLYGLSVKVPIGIWILFGLAVAMACWTNSRDSFRDELVLIIPALAIVILVSSQTGFNHHLRYVLPALPMVFIFIGRLASPGLWRHRAMRIAIVAACSLAFVSSVAAIPHSMSYFNEAAGGPLNGHAHLVDSNIDWGQDLLHLKRWREAHPEATPFFLGYWGPVEPGIFGIEYVPVPARVPLPASAEGGNPAALGLKPGWYAVSVNYLRGKRPIFSRITNLLGPSIDRPVPIDVTGFRVLEPVDHAGYSIYIYHVSGEGKPPWPPTRKPTGVLGTVAR